MCFHRNHEIEGAAGNVSDCLFVFVCREDIRTANVIAAEEVTCLVIDRE